MVSFFVSVAALIAGYFIYGKFVDRVFGSQPERVTPAYSVGDGVDYVPMSWTKSCSFSF